MDTKLSKFLPQDREKITLGQLILAACFILLAFSSCTVAISNKNLSQQKVTNVQLLDGTAISIEQHPANYREPTLIKNFVQQWLMLMFSWDGKIPGTEQPDPGVKTPNNNIVPINAWGASLMMEPKFGQTFLDELGTLIPSNIFHGSLKSTIIVRYISEPQQLNETTHRVNVIADRLLFDETQRTQKSIPFNKTITLKTTVIPNSPLKDKANTLEKTVHKMRISGLEIIEITDYEP